MYVSFFKI